MNKSPTRSRSTNKRLKPRPGDDLSSLSIINTSQAVSSSLSLNKSTERIPKFKLPKLPAPSTRISSQDTPIPGETSEDQISSLKTALKTEWDSKNIPVDLQHVFAQWTWALPRHKAVAVVSREIDDLKHNRSSMQTALRAVNAREESLASIYEMNNYLKEVTGWDKMKDVQLECAELLHAHRILTLNAVESIVKWRDLILFSALVNNEPSSRHIPFVWKEKNYLLKMKNDLDFLKTSEFSKVFCFEENDPLLTKPSQPLIKTKDKKIDHNYFIQHGQVVVSLPSSLRAKVEFAEDVIGKEVKMENMLKPAQVEEISNVIYEELCEEEVMNEVDDYLKNNKPEFRALVATSLLENEIESLCEKIANEAKAEAFHEFDLKVPPLITENWVDDEILSLIEKIAKEEIKASQKEKNDNLVRNQRIKEENFSIARLIYNDLFKDVIEIMITQAIGEITETLKENEKKLLDLKKNKENMNISEAITKELIEVMINEISFEFSNFLIEEQKNKKLWELEYNEIFLELIKETINQQVLEDFSEKIKNQYVEEVIREVVLEFSNDLVKDQSDTKTKNEIYNDLLNECIKEVVSEQYSEVFSEKDRRKQVFLSDLSEKIYFDLFESLLIEVPSIAKQVYDDSHQIYSDKSELLENIGLDFPSENSISDISGLIFKKVQVPESVFLQVISEYYSKIPISERRVTAEIEKLEDDTSEIEAYWYWGLISNKIIGLLVFSINIDRDDVRVINIHHLSCLDWKFYNSFIDEACKFIWSSDHCQEIRLNLYVEGPTEIPADIKKILNSLKFRWKTSLFDEDENCTVIVMGKLRPAIKMKDSGFNKKNLFPVKNK